MQLGALLVICDGEDPDLTVGSGGELHLVYQRDGGTWYRRVDYPETVGDEYYVGDGGDPQLVLDSGGQPHVVMGALTYGRWTGAGFETQTLAAAWRKPRLAIDSQDRVYATVSREQSPRVNLYALQSGALLAGPVEVGQDNNGGIDVDSQGLIHISWRDSSVYYVNYDLQAGVSGATELHGSSDFSWIAADHRDDSLHLVNTVRHGEGIHYRRCTEGVWSQEQVVAYDEVAGVDDADNTGPTIDVDISGNKYVAFAGRDRVPWFFVIDAAGAVSEVQLLDPEQVSVSGGKYQNPNVGAHPDRYGACVAWGDGLVVVRCIGISGSQRPSP